MNIDPITIILFLIFFVAPIVNNFLRRGQGSGQQGPQEQTNRRPQQRRSQQQGRQARSDDSEADTSSGGKSAGDDFRGRLEEARRRVQEAMNSGDSSERPAQPEPSERSGSDLFPRLEEEKRARSQQGRAQRGSPQESQRSFQGGSQQGSQQGQNRGQARPAFGDLGREGVSRQRSASQQGTQSQQGAVGTDLGDAPPLRVQRLGSRKSSKIDRKAPPRGVLEFDRRSVMQGIIWREILDEPLSKRKRRKRH